ncbi:hypothetical protein MKW98_004059 [Papaver atlanticum]|uniref:Uncharacterized protein n=1 Tax=Papaver atlanticum TaxID=357466 RepID=A0AAD4XPT5_9MAGN|nr:hypothetical protein MKW98_004059 [Papaver atlanticum]
MSSSCAVLQQVRHGLIRSALPKVSSSVSPLMGPPEIYKISNPPSPPLPPPSSSGNPLFDFFYHVVPGTKPKTVVRRLELAWNYDSLIALKLICNSRGVRGTGKSDKTSFYAAALWLHKHHPKTLACNVRTFAEFGSFKDLPEILHQIITKKGKEEEEPMPRPKSQFKLKLESRKEPMIERWRIPADIRIQANMDRDQIVKKRARIQRKEARIKKAVRAIETYNGDANYRFLHDRISEVFAECLVSDLQNLNSGNIRKISFASKWCPSLDLSYDQSTLLCESIARRIFPRELFPEYEKIDEAHYRFRIRDRLRKEVLVPLRSALKLPELYMSSNNWRMLPYDQVPSVAMKRYRKTFMKYDKGRFKSYRKSIKQGEKKIAVGTLLPHQILAASRYDQNVAEIQWRRMVEDLLKISKLKDSLAIWGGPASGRAKNVSMALSLLVSEMSQGPWKGKLMTFWRVPTLEKIEGDDLSWKESFVIEDCHMDIAIDFQRVFDVILQVAVDGKLKEDEMIKRLYVFTKMEFKYASHKVITYRLGDDGEVLEQVNGDWETDYREIQKKFRERGFSNVPEIVFWNLEHPVTTVVKGGYTGVTLVSGFSCKLLKLFVEGDIDDINPVALMESAISGKEYDKLVVVD